jgi:hypothetical protein
VGNRLFGLPHGLREHSGESLDVPVLVVIVHLPRH